MDKKDRKSMFAKGLWLLRHRPGHLFGTARGYFLFYQARLLRSVFPLNGCTLADNVRLQRNTSLMAESPSARIAIGANSIIYEDAHIEAYGQGAISVGSSSIIGISQIFSRYRIRIGERFLSSWNVFIQDYDSHPTADWQRRQQVEAMTASFKPNFSRTPPITNEHALRDWDFPGEEIIIGDDVWVGAGATILKGVTIGSGSIVACGAVVTKGCYPCHSLIAGNPASVVKTFIQPNSRQHDKHDLGHAIMNA